MLTATTAQQQPQGAVCCGHWALQRIYTPAFSAAAAAAQCNTIQHTAKIEYTAAMCGEKNMKCVSELNSTQVHYLCLFTIHMCVCMCETFFGIRHLESSLPLFIYHVHVCVCVCVCARAYRVRAYGFAVAYYIDAFLCHMLMLSAMLWQIHTCAYAWVYACVVLAFCSNLYHLTGVLRTTYLPL